jgi:hypothetical protein
MAHDGELDRRRGRLGGACELAVDAVIHRTAVKRAEADAESLIDASEAEACAAAYVVSVNVGASAGERGGACVCVVHDEPFFLPTGGYRPSRTRRHTIRPNRPWRGH